MIDGLIAGKEFGQLMERTSKAGKLFAVAKVRAATGDGESLFVNVITFDTAPCAARVYNQAGLDSYSGQAQISTTLEQRL